MHRNVAGGATSTPATLLIRLDAPHNAGAVPRACDQVRATIVQGYAGDYVQMAGHRGHGLALVEVVHAQGVVPDAAGVQELAIRAHRKELRVRRLRGVKGSKDALAVPGRKLIRLGVSLYFRLNVDLLKIGRGGIDFQQKTLILVVGQPRIAAQYCGFGHAD